MWRGDRGASCTPSGKGQGGVVAVYLVKVTAACARLGTVCLLVQWHGRLVEHPYHASVVPY